MGIMESLGLSGAGIGNTIINILMGAVVLILVGGLIAAWIFWTRQKKMYSIPVSLIEKRDNGAHKRRDDLVGGMKKRKDGVTSFFVKPARGFKTRDLGYVPDFAKARPTDGRLIFVTQGDKAVWQQCEEKLQESETTTINVKDPETGNVIPQNVTYQLLAKPIPTDIKTVTINNIHSAENLFNANQLKATSIAIGAFVIMVIVQVIFLFLVSK